MFIGRTVNEAVVYGVAVNWCLLKGMHVRLLECATNRCLLEGVDCTSLVGSVYWRALVGGSVDWGQLVIGGCLLGTSSGVGISFIS